MVLYFLTPNKFKNLTLLGVSLAFYSWGEPKYFLIMLASIFVDYLVSRGIEKYRKNHEAFTFWSRKSIKIIFE